MICPSVFADDIARVDETIRSTVRAAIPLDDERVGEPVRYMIEGDGKRLRPLLTIGAARASGNGASNGVIELAAAIDLIHHATLHHDDVIDATGTRRGRPTADRVWSNKISVLAGDILFVLASRLIDETMPGGNSMVAQALVGIVKGELRQALDARHIEKCAQRYIDAANEKTGLLTSLACTLGGLNARANGEAASKLASFGRDFGIAYQLADDACDYGARWNGYAKGAGRDFREGIVTMPAILAWSRGTEEERLFWRRAIESGAVPSDTDFDQAVELMHRHSAIEDTVIEAKMYGDRAKAHLGMFHDNVAADGLAWLVDRYIGDVEA